ncbi:MAG: rhomboid family intramembrane serine protease [Gemmatimonadales bacterium]|nr:rhomboid family intramembrane serine protease [Gemmatimonadales bacterium]
MFPYKDENPTLRTPVVTYLLIGLNLASWFLLQGLGSEPALSASVCELGLIPGEVLGRVPAGVPIPMGAWSCETDGVGWITVLSSMFLHGGWFHLLGNMWFLWVFGNNVEDSMGRARFLLFYLATGAAAAAAQIGVNPGSVIPMVGASGAISGVMGAYIVLYPRVRVHMLVFLGIFITRVAVPAVFMLGYWFLLQLVGGIPALAREGGGVAFWAHAGGFVAGMVLVFLFRDPKLLAVRRSYRMPA